MSELELALREAQKRLQTDNSDVDFSEELKKELALLLPQLQIQKEPQSESSIDSKKIIIVKPQPLVNQQPEIYSLLETRFLQLATEYLEKQLGKS